MNDKIDVNVQIAKLIARQRLHRLRGVLLSFAVLLPITSRADLAELIDNVLGTEPIDRIEISVSFDSERCSAEYPLLVSIENGSRMDMTNLRFLAYAHDPEFSRAECAEHYDLGDRIVRTGTTYTACWATLDSQGISFAGRRISDAMLDDHLRLDPIEWYNEYGSDAVDIPAYLARAGLKHQRLTQSVDPRQSLGCRNVPHTAQWRGKILHASEFSGF